VWALAETGMRAEGERLQAAVLLSHGAARSADRRMLIGGPYWETGRPVVFGPMTTQTLQRWICESCGYIYDPEEGDPDGGIPAGTAFEDIPDTWFCPVCGARKRDFTLYED
jgi:rubredoxin